MIYKKDDLLQKILIQPIARGADNLRILSGYSTAAMAFHHLNLLTEMGHDPPTVELIIGMCPVDGISLSNHLAFKKLMEEDFKDRFNCSYIYGQSAIHSKLYIWCQGETPSTCFVGSANYTQKAFFSKQGEVMVQCPPELPYDYFQEQASNSIFCNHSEVESNIKIFDHVNMENTHSDEEYPQRGYFGLEKVTISFLANNGTLPQRSGLNWGQRPEYRREPNQAYIRVPAEIYREEFFPPTGNDFTVLTDDGKVLICKRAQENGKAIETPHNNSQIGEYFRNRLDIASGNSISTEDLIRYGRTNVDFYKIDEETYLMDFSVP